MSETADLREEADEHPGVSTLELFFDLVFVFTITQLTGVLVGDPSWDGLLQVALMLGIIFWMYGGYAWLTNSVTLDGLLRRLTLLGGMAGFLIIALAVPQAFSGAGATFGLAYLGVVLIHFGMFAKASKLTVAQAMVALVPFNVTTALMVAAGGIIGGTAQYVIWTLAFVLAWVSPKLIDDSGFEISPGHFVERHGLVVIVVLGESIVSVGIGAAGLPVDAQLISAALLGLALSGCLWWSYFGLGEEEATEAAFFRAPMGARPRLAINVFGYAFFLLLIGVVAIAAALKSVTAHPFDPLPTANAIALGGGVASFVLGEAWFRSTLGIGAAGIRALAGLAALATIPLGCGVEASVQVIALLVILIGMLLAQSRTLQARPA